MKKLLALFVASLLVLTVLAGCGGGGEVTGHEGKYLSVAGEMMGEDVLGMGMKITIAKEGSEAASDPSLGLSEDEKKCVGEWKSDAVTDALDEDASGEIEPTALTMNLKADKSAEITYKGEDMGEQKWSFALGSGSFEDFDITFKMNDDGSMEVTYFEGDDYYNFHCVK